MNQRYRRLSVVVDPKDDGEADARDFTGVSPYTAFAVWLEDTRRKTGQRWRVLSATYSWPR